MRAPGTEAVARTGIGVAAVGHRRSERFGLRVLAGLLRRRFAALDVRVAEGE
jgi:putative NIF3 family GTP cyclohydrolase 1 type 2